MHVAIIMDRNGEWARRRGLSRIMGHQEGVKSVRRIVTAASDLDVKVLSLFAFSTENWSRPKDEVNFLMKLLEEYITKEARDLVKNGIKLTVSGRTDRIPSSAKRALETVIAESANNQGMVLNIALDYGGRDEIVQAAKRFAKDIATSNLSADVLDEKIFSRYLYHPEFPDVDLLIRTGGELRISNFMLWQMAYAELYFTDVLWPDFTETDLKLALEDFAKRTRRFGKTDEC
jgi:undecaprenyl diphosphate synthase